MFIYSIKGNTLKFVGIICLAAVLMISLLILVPKNSAEAEPTVAESTVNYDKIKSNGDRVEFLEQFGWKVDKTPERECVVRIPKNFDSIMSSYNEIQKSQGLDLEKYAGKEAVRYTYKIKNFPDYDGAVFANITVYKNAVIAGDICSSDVDGFIRDLSFPKSEDDTETPETEASPETEAIPETTLETAAE